MSRIRYLSIVPPRPLASVDIALGDAESFRRAYQMHHGALVVVAWRVLRDNAAAEDVVQDVFMDLWCTPSAYDPRRGSLRSYLRMIVKSRALDRWRSRVVAVAAVERARAQGRVVAETDASAAEQVTHREAILLAYGSGLSTPELATVTGTPLGTAKSRVRLGLNAARKTLMANEAA